MPDVSVRRATRGDLPAVLELDRATAEASHWTGTMYEHYLSEENSSLHQKALLVVVADEAVLGFAALSAAAGEAELESIVVAASRRRSGLGRRLLQEAGNWARTRGIRFLLLEVRAANIPAQSFYAREGFQAEGVRPRYYRDPTDDAVLMRLALHTTASSTALGPGREL